MSHSRKWIALLLVGSFLVLPAGCGKVTADNYDKIKTGMTVDEVTAILGKGKEGGGVAGAIGDATGLGKVLTWGDEKKSITVTFVSDKVAVKTQKGLK